MMRSSPKDLNGTVSAWNVAAERLHGCTAAEAVGQSIPIVIPRDRQHEEGRIPGKSDAYIAAAT
jgi:PAS domain S-box-containing protein